MPMTPPPPSQAEKGCWYIMEHFASAASHNGFCTHKLSHQKYTNIIKKIKIKNIGLFYYFCRPPNQRRPSSASLISTSS